MTQTMEHTVSVVIPVKDRREALLRAVASASRQTFPVREIVVVDDGSRESFEPDLKGFPKVTYIRFETSKGAPYARNVGWQRATSSLIAFLDSDDELEPGAVEAKVSVLTTKGLDMVVGSVKLDDGKNVRSIRYNPDLQVSLRDNLLGNRTFDARTSTFLLKRDVLAVVAFDEQLRKHQDWDLFINIDYKFKTGFTNNCDTIVHVSAQDRISNALKHESTAYFISKNRNKVSADAMFLFVLKMLFRAQRIGDSEGERLYLKVMRDGFKDLSLVNRVIKFLITSGLISAKLLHSIKRLLKR